MPTRGFTLLELLVVLVILGVVVSLVTLNTTPNPHTQLQLEGERLTALLSVAQEEAQLRGRSLAWQPQPQGYAFFEWQGASWQPLDVRALDSASLRARTWPDFASDYQLQIQLQQNNQYVSRIEFPAQGITQPFQIRLVLSTQASTSGAPMVGLIESDGVGAVRWRWPATPALVLAGP